MYILYYYPGNASLAVHMMLEALGADYELALVDRASNGQKSAEYLALNPAGRIPTLVDHKFLPDNEPLVIFESAAICQHLLERHPDSKLIPEVASAQRSEFYQWLMYLNNSVQAELMLYFYPEKYTSDFNGCEAVKHRAEQRVTEMFELLNDKLATSTFIVGEQLSVCDFFLFMVANWAASFEKAPLHMANLKRYLQMMARQECVKQAFSNEGRDLKKYQ